MSTLKSDIEKAVAVRKLDDPMVRVRAELTAAGITDPVEQANVLAQIEAESALKPRSESLKYSGKRLYELFGPNQKRNKVRFKTLDEAKTAAAKGEEHIASLLYDGRKDLGNDKDGDGWKFRGRGFIQLTGKDNYRRYGKRIGVDLEANPDLANDPEIATKLAVAYFADKKKKGVDFKDPMALTKAVGPADPKAPQLRAELAKKYLDGGTPTPPGKPKAPPQLEVAQAGFQPPPLPKVDLDPAKQAFSNFLGGAARLGSDVATGTQQILSDTAQAAGSVELPKLSMPQVQPPQVSLPQVSLPQVQPPQVSLPQVSAPDLDPVKQMFSNFLGGANDAAEAYVGAKQSAADAGNRVIDGQVPEPKVRLRTKEPRDPPARYEGAQLAALDMYTDRSWVDEASTAAALESDTTRFESAPTDFVDAFNRGAGSGMVQMGADFDYARAAFAGAFGDQDALQYYLGRAKEAEGRSAEIMGATQSLEQLFEDPTFEGFFNKAAGTIGQVTPSLAATIASAFATGGASAVGAASVQLGGKQLTISATKKLVKDAALKKARGEALDADEEKLLKGAYLAIRRGRADAFKKGAVVGAFGVEQPQMTGASFREFQDAGVDLNDPNYGLAAIGIGGGLAVVGVYGEKLIAEGALGMLTKQGDRLPYGKNVLTRVTSDFAKLAGKSAVVEGTTEVIQEGGLIAQRKFVDPDYSDEEIKWRLAESAFAGAVAGGAMGGAGGIVTGVVSSINVEPPVSVESLRTEATRLRTSALNGKFGPQMRPGYRTEYEAAKGATPQYAEDYKGLIHPAIQRQMAKSDYNLAAKTEFETALDKMQEAYGHMDSGRPDLARAALDEARTILDGSEATLTYEYGQVKYQLRQSYESLNQKSKAEPGTDTAKRIMDRAKDMLKTARGKMQQGEETAGDTQVTVAGPTPEPQADYEAQVAHLGRTNSPKRGVWIPENAGVELDDDFEPNVPRQTGNVWAVTIPGQGTLVTRTEEDAAALATAENFEAELARILGYSAPKPVDADRVVRVLNGQGAVIFEEATNEVGVAAAEARAAEIAATEPGATTDTVDSVEALRQRAGRREQESSRPVSSQAETPAVEPNLPEQEGPPIVRNMIDNNEDIDIPPYVAASEAAVAAVKEARDSVRKLLTSLNFKFTDSPDLSLSALERIASKYLIGIHSDDPAFLDDAAKALSYALYTDINENVDVNIPRPVIEKALRSWLEDGKPPKIEKTVWTVIVQALNRLMSIFSGKEFATIESVLEDTIVGITTGRDFSYKPRAGFAALSFQKEMDNNPLAVQVMTSLRKSGLPFALTGSVAYADQVPVYRKVGSPLHDVDLLFAPEDMDAALKWFSEGDPENWGDVQTLYSFSPGGRKTVGIAAVPAGYEIRNLSSIWNVKENNPQRSYDVYSKETGEKVGSYFFLRGSRETFEGIAGITIDLIADLDQAKVPQSFTHNGETITLDVASYIGGFAAKLAMLRPKDVADFKAVVPPARQTPAVRFMEDDAEPDTQGPNPLRVTENEGEPGIKIAEYLPQADGRTTPEPEFNARLDAALEQMDPEAAETFEQFRGDISDAFLKRIETIAQDGEFYYAVQEPAADGKDRIVLYRRAKGITRGEGQLEEDMEDDRAALVRYVKRDARSTSNNQEAATPGTGGATSIVAISPDGKRTRPNVRQLIGLGSKMNREDTRAMVSGSTVPQGDNMTRVEAARAGFLRAITELIEQGYSFELDVAPTELAGDNILLKDAQRYYSVMNPDGSVLLEAKSLDEAYKVYANAPDGTTFGYYLMDSTTGTVNNKRFVIKPGEVYSWYTQVTRAKQGGIRRSGTRPLQLNKRDLAPVPGENAYGYPPLRDQNVYKNLTYGDLMDAKAPQVTAPDAAANVEADQLAAFMKRNPEATPDDIKVFRKELRERQLQSDPADMETVQDTPEADMLKNQIQAYVKENPQDAAPFENAGRSRQREQDAFTNMRDDSPQPGTVTGQLADPDVELARLDNVLGQLSEDARNNLRKYKRFLRRTDIITLEIAEREGVLGGLEIFPVRNTSGKIEAKEQGTRYKSTVVGLKIRMGNLPDGDALNTKRNEQLLQLASIIFRGDMGSIRTITRNLNRITPARLNRWISHRMQDDTVRIVVGRAGIVMGNSQVSFPGFQPPPIDAHRMIIELAKDPTAIELQNTVGRVDRKTEADIIRLQNKVDELQRAIEPLRKIMAQAQATATIKETERKLGPLLDKLRKANAELATARRFAREQTGTGVSLRPKDQTKRAASLKIHSKLPPIVRRVQGIVHNLVNPQSPVDIFMLSDLTDAAVNKLGLPADGLAAMRWQVDKMRRDNRVMGSVLMKGRYIIIINDNVYTDARSDARMALTLSHEYGHILFHEQLKQREDGTVDMEPELARMYIQYRKDRIAAGKKPETFEEWFSDQVAAYVYRSAADMPQKRIDKNNKGILIEKEIEDTPEGREVKKLFKFIADTLRKVFNAVNAALRGRFDQTLGFTEWFEAAVEARRTNPHTNVLLGLTVKNMAQQTVHGAPQQQLGAKLIDDANGLLRDFMKEPINTMKRTLYATDDFLRSLGPAGVELAKFFHGRAQSKEGMGFHAAKTAEQHRWFTRLADAVGIDRDKMTPDEIDDILFEAEDNTVPTAQLSPKAQAVRQVFDDMYEQYLTYTDPSGNKKKWFSVKKGENYSPRQMNTSLIAENPQAFADALVAEGETRADADAIAAYLAMQAGSIVPQGNGPLDAPMMPHGRSRTLAHIPTKRLRAAMGGDPKYGWILPPQVAMTQYIHFTTRKVEYERRGGKDTLERLVQQVPAERRHDTVRALEANLGKLGDDIRFRPAARQFNSILQVATTLTTLTFAVFASLPDLAGVIIRSKDFSNFTTAIRELKLTMTEPENRAFARSIGVVTNQSLETVFMAPGEMDYTHPWAKKIIDKFFWLNGTEAYTRFVRTFAAGMGREFIIETAMADDYGPRHERYLTELGLTQDDVKSWFADNQPMADLTPGTRDHRIANAISRFAEEAIIRPNSALKPGWASNPYFNAVWQLKSYFYAYGKIVVAGMYREFRNRVDVDGDAKGAYQQLAIAAGAILILTMLGLEAREWTKWLARHFVPFGLAGDPDMALQTDNMNMAQYSWEIFDRSGLMGPFTLATSAMEGVEREGFLGPVIATVPGVDMVDDSVFDGDWSRLLPVVNNL